MDKGSPLNKDTLNQASEPSGRSRIEQDQLGLERIIFFSDAVFAIAITLLALDIRLPPIEGPVTDEQLLQSLLAIWPKYLGFIISFLVIGVYWMAHHRKFRLIERYDTKLILLNLLLLMTVAFIPFPTSVISEYGNRTATIFYALTAMVMGLLLAAIWWHASNNYRLIPSHVSQHQCQREMLRTLVAPIIFGLSIALAFFDDDLAKFSWLLIGVFLRLL